MNSEPTGSSETPLFASPSAESNASPAGEMTVTAPSTVTEPGLSLVKHLAGETPADVFALTPRENTPPKNGLDAKDRSEIRATKSPQALALKITYDQHHDRLEWQRAKRHLLMVAGIMALSIAFAIGLKFAGLQPKDVAKLTTLAFISGVGGYGLHAVGTKAWNAISSRDSARQRESSR